jgi:hypothetical protein
MEIDNKPWWLKGAITPQDVLRRINRLKEKKDIVIVWQWWKHGRRSHHKLLQAHWVAGERVV